MTLCNDYNYRETRWFMAWRKHKQTEDHYLPRMIQDITGQVGEVHKLCPNPQLKHQFYNFIHLKNPF